MDYFLSKKFTGFSFALFILSLFWQTSCIAANRTIDLVISHKTVNFANKETSKAIVVNDQIPAPTLHFKEGDQVTINVCNNLDEDTAFHWHGVLVPWQMDGVKGVTQKAIQPGETFQYQFTLHQSGTYWYHAHAGIQEQEGVYGAFLIDPHNPPEYKYTKDYVIVLSDWINTPGHQVFLNLKKEGDYYSPKFPLQPSLMKFMHDYRNADKDEKKALLDDYIMMQQMRMSIYDLSDVAYDAYLLNGHTKDCPWTAPVIIGDVVRLRFIGAAGSTIYRVKIPGTKMKVVHIQGNDVMPYEVDDFSIAPGETMDVLVSINKDEPYIIYAESIDTRGVVVGGLITNPDQQIDYCAITPFLEPKPVTRDMMENMMIGMMNMSDMSHANESKSMEQMTHDNKATSHKKMTNMNMSMGNMKMNSGMTMDHSMEMPTEPSIIGDVICPLKSAKNKMHATMSMPSQHEGTSLGEKPCIKEDTDSKPMTMGTKYQNLMAAVKTNDPNKPVDGIIRMELFGYMNRFI